MQISGAGVALAILMLGQTVSATPANTAPAENSPQPATPTEQSGAVVGPIQDAVPAVADGGAPPAEIAAQTRLTLPRDTPVHLMVVSEVTSKTHEAGYRFPLRVDQPVIVGGTEVIPVGARAWGQVTSARRSGNVGKSGELAIELLYVEAGEVNVPIDGERSDKGNSGTAETVMGVLSLGVLGLFAKGNNAKIKAGEKITAFTIDDIDLLPPAQD